MFLATPTQAAPRKGEVPQATQERRAQVERFLGVIDLPVPLERWRSLGPAAVPLLESVLADGSALPSRRAGAVVGLAAIGGPSARARVLAVAASREELLAVRVTAIRASPLLTGTRELLLSLRPLMQESQPPGVRAAAAEVLAKAVPEKACPTVRGQAEREAPESLYLARALSLCAEALPPGK